MNTAAKNLTHGARELIAFRIGEQEFCVDIMNVREIRGWTPATPIPHAPSYLLGVINLRGEVLPIIDLAARFGLKSKVPSDRNVIIVAQIQNRIVGMLVEAVSDILSISDDSIQPTPDMASDFERTFARGIIAIDRRMICMVELNFLSAESESIAA
jgi:purine-binding chemotaxis protein CheW